MIRNYTLLCADVHQRMFQWTPLMISINGWQLIELNPHKSEAILNGSQARLRRESAIHELKLDNVSVKLAQLTKSLGLTIDNKLTLIEHVNVCKAAHYHLWVLRHVRRYVSEDVAKSIATSLVSARLDYYNTVFYGTLGKIIDKLQQNTLAWVVKEHSKYDHIAPLLSELHWLPIEERIRHKIADLTFWQASRAIWLNWSQLTHQQGTKIQFMPA